MLTVTATNLPRLLTCNGSRLLSSHPTAESDNTVRDEGNAADWVIQQVFTGQFLLEELVDRKAPNGVYITAEMAENLTEYLAWVAGKGRIEQDCSYQSPEAWEVRGRADHVWYDDRNGRLYVSDFKYGWKIVDVEENWTLISHAVGWMLQNNIQPVDVAFRIYQPRPYHPEGTVRVWGMTGGELVGRYHHINGVLTNPSDQLQTSRHCYKCPAMATCPAAQIAGMNALDVAYRAFDSEPTNEQIEFLIEETRKAADILKQNLSAYEEIALHRLKNGQHFKNYSVQTDYGRETWRDDITPDILQMMTGMDVARRVLPTPKQAVTAGMPEDFVKSLTMRPSKGVKLVRMNASEQAAKLLNKRS